MFALLRCGTDPTLPIPSIALFGGKGKLGLAQIDVRAANANEKTWIVLIALGTQAEGLRTRLACWDPDEPCASYISLYSSMPKRPKVVSITTAQRKAEQQPLQRTEFPVHARAVIGIIECRRSPISIELRVLRPLNTPTVRPLDRVAPNPAKWIPIRETSEDT